MPEDQGSLDKQVADAIGAFEKQVRTNKAYCDDVTKLVQDVIRGDSDALGRLAEKIAPDARVRKHLLSLMHANQDDDTVFVGIALALFAGGGPMNNQWHASTLDCLIRTRPPLVDEQ